MAKKKRWTPSWPQAEKLPPRKYPYTLERVPIKKILVDTKNNPLLEPENHALAMLVAQSQMLGGRTPVTCDVPVPLSDLGVHNPPHLEKVTALWERTRAGETIPHMPPLHVLGSIQEDLERREFKFACYRGKQGQVVSFDDYTPLYMARKLGLDVVMCNVIEAAPNPGE